MNQELDDECSLQEPINKFGGNTIVGEAEVHVSVPELPMSRISNNTFWDGKSFSEDDEPEVEYLSKGEAAVLYIVISVASWLLVWGAWKLLKTLWHGIVWLVTR